ncbi:tRNA (N(6)-L-threonylcarbamoyladenosine(37)-C(2))-methylthiotransferase MtaB [Megasphaera vaginalis (ex Srinivasan et al. 2021)]|uniref:Threonylcarbamoyladenosine tRNA methylthiotransferase MtaB n=1 Tax=Megasphaera vaginalis (ex Srinivasan et al. 2021) TaxID=1111454 RepID=U7UL16_9FIRM|nr:tRNA (N(6)-L-threonylcarbamoyladenosine(37)-C(2))-methylthiotransferase MtaB [Megasphaera vaginalis (ex Srinivasan et al. 2021)]ERT60030.1 MiaB-like protein [Megasphaera vaginalis (ex Srinivasan et al. 2021)]
MPSIAFATLGCRVNQYDTDSMRGLFLSKGFQEAAFHDVADVYVINTCSVTQMGEKKSRQMIRRAKKLNRAALIVVTGCYAQLSPDVLAAMPDVDAVVGTNEKKEIVRIVDSLLERRSGAAVRAVHNIMGAAGRDVFEEIPLYPSAVAHTRADLKIQEGCNNFCTYCIIPYTRGSLKSRQPDAVIAEAKRLTAFGFRELVLTGIHLGAYGIDLPARPTLALILRRLLEETDVARIRMGSIESVEIRDDLIDVMNSSERICPHLHLPLQSGSDTILRAMGRHYTKNGYIALIEGLQDRIGGLTVSTDLILGFPGETEALFAETLETLGRLHFSHIHAFPYSQRQGTPAADMPNQVENAVKKRRVEIVNALSRRQKAALLQKLVGREVQVLIEKQSGNWGEGFSEQYERVQLTNLRTDVQGTVVPVILTGVEKDILSGIIKEER